MYMREHNIARLIEASPFIHGNEVPQEVQDLLCEYLMNTECTLDSINIDDIVINSLTCLSVEELPDFNDPYILAEVDYQIWVLR